METNKKQNKNVEMNKLIIIKADKGKTLVIHKKNINTLYTITDS
jgi:hypothetical protein